jgi:hypothetical protein
LGNLSSFKAESLNVYKNRASFEALEPPMIGSEDVVGFGTSREDPIYVLIPLMPIETPVEIPVETDAETPAETLNVALTSINMEQSPDCQMASCNAIPQTVNPSQTPGNTQQTHDCQVASCNAIPQTVNPSQKTMPSSPGTKDSQTSDTTTTDSQATRTSDRVNEVTTPSPYWYTTFSDIRSTMGYANLHTLLECIY